ncbi:MAG: M23 family metallopeptidase [Spirochaetia bacterium]
MRNRVVLAVLLSGLFLFSFDWPVSRVLITATFGESRGDHFHSGIDLAGEEQKITPVSPGKLVFRYDEGSSYSSVPVGLGSFVVLEDKTGIRSIYGHIKKRTIPTDKKSFQKNDVIGIMGNTGYSMGRHLHLTIIDHREKTILNPLTVYKNEAKVIKDRVPPVIEELYYKNNVGELTVLQSNAVVDTEKLLLYLRGYDLMGNTDIRVAPLDIKVVHNEMKIIDIRFNALQFKEGVYRLNSCGKSFSDIYTPGESFSDLLCLGEVGLVNGKNILTISLTDFYGNTTSREVDVWVGSPR